MLFTVFGALACIVALGSVLMYLFRDLNIDSLRQNINKLVLYIFLPALNFNVIYTAQIGHEFWQLPVLAFVSVFILAAIGVLIYTFVPVEQRSKGALVLACAFGNVTYFGIAVLQGLFPNNIIEATKVAILFEITITPLNLVLGPALAALYSKNETFSLKKCLLDVVKMPLLWSTFIALALNLLRVPAPSFIVKSTAILASTVSGLMILALGMALKYPTLALAMRRVHYLLPVLVIKLLLSPFLMYVGVKLFHVANFYSFAGIMEAAMPSQLISLAIADRFNLDIEILAIAISFDTVVSFVTLPLVHTILSHLLT
jgi:predicted permease